MLSQYARPPDSLDALLLPFIQVKKQNKDWQEWVEQMAKENTKVRKISQLKAFPPNLKTKE